MGKASRGTLVSLEMPRFGQFARHVAPITTADLAECLEQQARQGGRLGEMLVDRGLLEPEQIIEILRRQARWVAEARSTDLPGQRFPLPITFSLCMPCYNEADVIESSLDAACAILPEFVEEYEIVVVNDGSKDDTAEVVERYAERNSNVRLIHHETNRGYGAAVTSGMKAAYGDWVCFTDSDGQFSMLDLPQLFMHMHHADVVIGYRHQRADIGIRKVNAWSWNQLIRLLLGIYVRDLDCAFKLFPRSLVEQLQMTASGACINAEIMVQCVRSGLSIVEVPVSHYPRYCGKATGANLKVIAKAFRELPQLLKYRSAPPLVAPRRPLVAAVTSERTTSTSEIPAPASTIAAASSVPHSPRKVAS